MAIKLNNFVDIVIKKEVTSITTSNREVAVLVDSSAESELYYALNGTGDGSSTSKCASPVDENGAYLDDYLKVFFNNDGKVLHVVKDLTNLDRNEIVLAYKGTTAPTGWGVVTEGPDQKIFVNEVDEIDDVKSAEGMVYKVVPSGKTGKGSLMSILAYYTKTKIYTSDSCKDFAFTKETVDDELVVTDNTTVEAIQNAITNAICDVNLGNSIGIVAVGGNASNGEELTNLFYKIVLQQTLTDRLVALLASKIAYNDKGKARVSAVIEDELRRYVDNGYIQTGKLWKNEDLVIDNETILAKDESLTNGFTTYIRAFSTLTNEQRLAHQFPQIYIIYGDQYAIRKIAIEGQVF